jgi:hypothetical protein
MNHTAGPWRISQFEVMTGGVARVVMGVDDFTVASISGRSVEEHHADASLISAAPELLEALKISRPFVYVATHAARNDVLAQLDAAIAKAEGRP